MFPPCNPLHFPLAYKEAPSWCENMVRQVIASFIKVLSEMTCGQHRWYLPYFFIKVHMVILKSTQQLEM